MTLGVKVIANCEFKSWHVIKW